MRLRSRELFETVRAEGGLLPADLLRRVADGDGRLVGLAPADYHLAPGERLNEAITRSWNRLLGAWGAFDDARAKLPEGDAAAGMTRDRWLQPLFGELGYGRLVRRPAIEIEERAYPVFTQWESSPIHLVGCGVAIDRRTPGVAGAAGQSPHSLLQELLNRSPERLWGSVSNGLVLRVLRDNVALTRQAYVEFDLEAMFSGEAYADFVLLWLCCHQSRVEGDPPESCWLERWSAEAASEGTRALDSLRDGVQEAIEELGAGFLAHPANTGLRQDLATGELDTQDYYRQLLRLVYRLLFLFVAEDRDALLRKDADPKARERYREHYSTQRLRGLAHRRRGGRQHDRYEALKLVMDALHGEGCAPLGLLPLGSALWDPDGLGHLADAAIANERLLAAVRSLARVEDRGVARAVDFRNLGAEELGSIYESLLELYPELQSEPASFTLRAAAGSERKTTGTYYTPTSLITSLLDTALEPLLDEAAAAPDPEAAILALRLCDPACGSGHFLIAAANRMAKRLAAIRSGDAEPAPEALRHALRDVVGRCLYGVDVNPMAVELCKVSLWLEALEPGRPLSFLDHHVVRGNSLLGTTSALLSGGIPDAAFKPLLGDDRKVVAELRKRNARERSRQSALFDPGEIARESLATLARESAAVEAGDDGTLEEVRAKERTHRELLGSPEHERARALADAWCAAFVCRKVSGEPAITQGDLERLARSEPAGGGSPAGVVGELAERYRFFHFHLAFPDVFLGDASAADAAAQGGGFDLVLGNPPWERVKLQEKEFFAVRDPRIAAAPNKAARERLIAALADEDPALRAAFDAAKRESEGASHLLRQSGRYPLCGRGDVNTFAVFAELMRTTIGSRGRVGAIVPTGIATDDTTKLFFQDLVARESIVSLYDFENRERTFPAVDSRVKFCLLTLTGTAQPSSEGATYLFFATRPEHLDDPERRFTLTAADIELLNPNTRTCPIFRSRRDAELTKAIYRRVPVLVREGDPDGNPWGVEFTTMFHMANDSGLFRTRDQLEADGWELEGNVFARGGARYLPLYEAKMLHHFDHRWATYEPDGSTRLMTDDEKADPRTVAMPRYWVPEGEVDAKLAGKWDHGWLLGWRDITNSTNERTCIATIAPRYGFGHKFPLILLSEPGQAAMLSSVLASYVFDFVARQKLGGTSLTFFTMRQLAIPPPQIASRCPEWSGDALGSWVEGRWLELSNTARDLEVPGRSSRDGVALFPWDPGRRFLLRAELDAAFFHLYGLERDDVDYVLDTFPIVRRKDEKAYGEYRTKRVILEIYDEMARAAVSGEEYQTRLDPPPADPSLAVVEQPA